MDMLHRFEERTLINCLTHGHRWVTFDGQPTICASCEITKERWDKLSEEMRAAAKVIEDDFLSNLRMLG
jgi:hypothetical protein